MESLRGDRWRFIQLGGGRQPQESFNARSVSVLLELQLSAFTIVQRFRINVQPSQFSLCFLFQLLRSFSYSALAMDVAQEANGAAPASNMDASMDIDMDLDLGPLPEPEPIEAVSVEYINLAFLFGVASNAILFGLIRNPRQQQLTRTMQLTRRRRKHSLRKFTSEA